MTARRIGAAVLVAIAWVMAVGAGYLLWRHANWLRDCGPLGLAFRGWRNALIRTYALLALDLVIPAAATLYIRKHPGIAAALAAIQIVLIPIAFTLLSRWNTAMP